MVVTAGGGRAFVLSRPSFYRGLCLALSFSSGLLLFLLFPITHARAQEGDSSPVGALGSSGGVTSALRDTVARGTAGVSGYVDSSGAAAAASATSALVDTVSSPRQMITIDKETRLLTLTDNGSEVLRFPVAFGKKPGKKLKKGDRRTPEGAYRIVAKHARSKFHKFLWLSYPNEQDARKALASGLISKRDYEAISGAKGDAIPPQQTRLGGYVGIHGGKAVRVKKFTLYLDDDYDWTYGCIAAKNENIDRLFDRVEVGTRVVIR